MLRRFCEILLWIFSATFVIIWWCNHRVSPCCWYEKSQALLCSFSRPQRLFCLFWISCLWCDLSDKKKLPLLPAERCKIVYRSESALVERQDKTKHTLLKTNCRHRQAPWALLKLDFISKFVLNTLWLWSLIVSTIEKVCLFLYSLNQDETAALRRKGCWGNGGAGGGHIHNVLFRPECFV